MDNFKDPVDALDYVLNKLEQTMNNSVTDRFLMVRNRIASYYAKNYRGLGTPNPYVHRYSDFMFDIGMLTGTISYYKQHGKLTKEHIEDLNKIYKKYREVE